MPNEKWARRINGVLGNELANQFPNRAHAVLTEHEENVNGITFNEKPVYQARICVSKNNSIGVDEVATQLTGGGRKGAAGVDALPASSVQLLMKAVFCQWVGQGD